MLELSGETYGKGEIMQMPDTTRGRIPYMPLMFAAMLAMLALALYAPAALSQVRGPSGADGSFNCADFDTQEQAQAFFDAQGGLAGGDPDGLDADGDGIPCESLPSGEAEDGTMMPPGNGAGEEPTVSCNDFTTIFGEPSQFQAQQFFDTVATPEEQAILDPEGNGFACDGGQIVFGEDPAEAPAPAEDDAAAPVDEAPVAEAPVADDAAALPETGGPALLLPLAGLMVAAGLGLAFIRRR